MRTGTHHANDAERACLDLVEALLLRDRLGGTFDAFVIDLHDSDPASGTVHLTDPAVVAPVRGARPLPLGERLRVRLVEADVGRHAVLFAPA